MASVLENYKKKIKELEESLDQSGAQGLGLSGAQGLRKFGAEDNISDYGFKRTDYKEINFENLLKSANKDAWKLVEYGNDENNRALILEILNQSQKIKKGITKEGIKKILAEISKNLKSIKAVKIVENDISFIQIPKVPEAIAAEIAADLNELRKCFLASAYRSCVVLCGRVMETALHRKYYEVSGQDLLETAPNIGLGNLIAKLKEKNVKIDPGLTQQIHLINQVRVFSVHSKKEAFYPSREQAQATILFTLDVLKKLFG